MAASCVIDNDETNGADLADFAFVSALMWSFEGYGSSSVYYGASDGKVKWWDRPDVGNMGVVHSFNPSVQNDALDNDVYHRYVENAKLSLDFSTGAQDSTILCY